MVFFMPCFFHLYRKQMGLVHALMIFMTASSGLFRDNIFPPIRFMRFGLRKKGTTLSKSKKMGVVQLTTVTAINMMGSGIILLPATLAEIGTASIFAWILASIGATILAYAFARCGMHTSKVGGMGGYAEYRFGRAGNFLSN